MGRMDGLGGYLQECQTFTNPADDSEWMTMVCFFSRKIYPLCITTISGIGFEVGSPKPVNVLHICSSTC